MMKRYLLAALIASAATLCTNAAHAVTIDFEGFAEGTVITSQYAAQGVTFTALGSGGPFIATQGAPVRAFIGAGVEDTPMVSGVNGLTSLFADTSNNADIVANFSTPVSAVSVYTIDMDEFGLPYSLRGFDSANNQVAVQTINSDVSGVSGDGIATLFSISAPNMTKVVIDVPQGNFFGFAVDDLSFTPQVIPEPTTLMLLGIGLAGLVIACRRRKK